MDLEGIDFIDFGASAGASLRWAQSTFGKVGLGIDLDSGKVAQSRSAGMRVVQADATTLDVPSESVEFSIVTDFLEHLGTEENARLVINNAVKVARDFVYLAYPDFDNEKLLNKDGFKRYYADWSGHNLHLHTGKLRKILDEIGFTYQLIKLGEIFDSFDRSVLPMTAPRNSSFYDPTVYERKNFVVFPRKTFYTRNLCIVAKSPTVRMGELLVKIMSSIGYVRLVGTGVVG